MEFAKGVARDHCQGAKRVAREHENCLTGALVFFLLTCVFWMLETSKSSPTTEGDSMWKPVVLLLVLVWNPTDETRTSPSKMMRNDSLLATISDPQTSESQLLECIRRLRRVNEPATFWVKIVNDPKYSPRHRAFCLLELFRRHVKPGMSLGEVSEVLRGAPWLHEEQAGRFYWLSGYLPVFGDCSTDSLFALRAVEPDKTRGIDAVYITVGGGNVFPAQLVQVLKGETTDRDLGKLKLLDVWPRLRATDR